VPLLLLPPLLLQVRLLHAVRSHCTLTVTDAFM
jgi:hypothetical protein